MSAAGQRQFGAGPAGGAGLDIADVCAEVSINPEAAFASMDGRNAFGAVRLPPSVWLKFLFFLLCLCKVPWSL